MIFRRAESGFFDLLSAPGKRGFVSAVQALLRRPEERAPAGIYITLNPVDPVFLARALALARATIASR